MMKTGQQQQIPNIEPQAENIDDVEHYMFTKMVLVLVVLPLLELLLTQDLTILQGLQIHTLFFLTIDASSGLNLRLLD
ncbi:hypothetical protein ACJX0J_015512, partial [Zea mays]